MFSEMDIVFNGVILENNVPMTSGSVTTDRTRNTRYEASVDIGLYDWDTLPITSKGTRIRLYRGVESIGVRERIQVGEYQVFSYKRTNRGTVSTTLKGLENFLIESQFIRPRTPPYGTSTITAISDLIHEVLPDAEIVVTVLSTDRLVRPPGPGRRTAGGTRSPGWPPASTPRSSAGYDGRFYIVDAPDLTTSPGSTASPAARAAC
jgi:hypothetical protein